MMRYVGIVLVLLLMLSLSAHATPVFVVAGELTDASGNAVTGTLTVTVTNQTRGIQASAASQEGSYAVTLVAWPPDATTAAEVGDQLHILVTNQDNQQLAVADYPLTATDIEKAAVAIPLTVQSPVAPIPVLVVSGAVTDESGASVGAGWSVKVSNESTSLSVTGVTDASGKYVLALVSTQPDSAAAQLGDMVVVRVQDATGQRQAEQQHILNATDLQNAHANVPVTMTVTPTPGAATVQVTLAKALPAIPGSSTPVTITVQDAGGKPVTDALVTLSLTPKLGTLSKVTAQGDGTYTATYTAGTTLGKVTITAMTDNGKQGQASVELVVGPAVKLQLTLEPSELLAGSGETSTVLISVLDVAEHSVQGASVTLSLSPKLGTLTSPQAQADGTFHASYTAGETPGTVTITAQAGELKATEQLTLTERPEPSALRSEVQVDSPVRAGETATIQVTVLSGSGTPMAGVPTRIVIEDADKSLEPAPTDAQGHTQATVQLTRAGSYRVRVNLLPDGAVLDVAPLLVVIPGAASYLILEVPQTVERGNSVTLNVNAKDRYSNPVSDAEIQVLTTLGKVTSPAVSQEAGRYTATFLSDIIGDVTITASIAGGPDDEASLQVVDNRAVIYSASVESLQAKADETLMVTAIAEAGGKAMTFHIERVASAQERPMVETSPGVYKGSYRVLAGENVTDAAVVIQFTDASDNRTEFTLNTPVTLDTTPPPAPTNLQVRGSGITVENMANVTVNANATPERTVWLEVEGIGTFDSIAQVDGLVRWQLNASEWPNGDYMLEAYEEPDAVGNTGLKAHAVVTKDDRPTTAILFVQVRPTPIPYNSDGILEITIGFTTQPPENVVLDITLRPPSGEPHIYVLDRLPPDTPGTVDFPADSVGAWTFQVHWEGNVTHRATDREGSFDVVAAQGVLSLETSAESVKQEQPMLLRGELKPSLADQPIRVQALGPGVEVWQQLPGTFPTSTSGHFEATVTPDASGLWQYRATWDGLANAEGNRLYERTISRVVEVTANYPTGKVVIAVGGDVSQSHWEQTFFRLGQTVYDAFVDRGFQEENIRFLSPATKSPTDTQLNETELESAILDWGAQNLSNQENLYVYLLSDSEETDGFILQRGILGTERLDPSAVDQWLDTLNERGVNVVLFMESCYSGQYLHAASSPLKARRVVFTSAQWNKKANITRRDSFSSRFFTRLRLRQDFAEAFTQTKKSLQNGNFTNTPQVDANGDGVFNENEERRLLEGLYLGDPDRIYAGDAPKFFRWLPPLTLADGEHSATIEAVIIGGGVTVTAVLYAPGMFGTGTFESWESLEGETLELVGDENTGYRATYDSFTQPGTYTIFLYAENADGPAIPAMTTVTVPGKSTIAPWDTNGDGSVDVLDLVIVGSQFGESGDGLVADVNGDNAVDVLDLVVIGSHFGETGGTAAAPNWQPDLTRVRRALEALERVSINAHTLMARQQLAAWLRSQVQETRLLPNYPNPFNPETWFPYQLTKSASVTIRVYNVQGQLVRQLPVGHRSAGYYLDRDAAAYWDGRNEEGQLVASGTYYYQLRADAFTMVRKMLILK